MSRQLLSEKLIKLPKLSQFLNAETLERLYNSLNKKSGGYRLLMEKANRKRQKSRYDTLRNVEDGIDTDKVNVRKRDEET